MCGGLEECSKTSPSRLIKSKGYDQGGEVGWLEEGWAGVGLRVLRQGAEVQGASSAPRCPPPTPPFPDAVKAKDKHRSPPQQYPHPPLSPLRLAPPVADGQLSQARLESSWRQAVGERAKVTSPQ